MIEVVNTVEVYELNDVELRDIKSKKPKLVVKNHWNRSEFVVLQIDEGKIITVLAKDLKAAIDNSTNSARF